MNSYRKSRIKALIVINAILVLIGFGQSPRDANSVRLTPEDIARHQIEYSKYFLSPKSDCKLDDSILRHEGLRPRTVVSMRWVSRLELQHRLKYWRSRLKDTTTRWGKTRSENLEELVYFDNSVARYAQTMRYIEHPAGATFSYDLWRVWLKPEQGKALYNLVVNEFQKSYFVLDEPEDDSVCVIIMYVKDGELWVKHFYVSSRIGVHSVLYEARQGGIDCEGWHHRDVRFAISEWLQTELKYSPSIWGPVQ